jgi:hypothetical protein
MRTIEIKEDEVGIVVEVDNHWSCETDLPKGFASYHTVGEPLRMGRHEIKLRDYREIVIVLCGMVPFTHEYDLPSVRASEDASDVRDHAPGHRDHSRIIISGKAKVSCDDKEALRSALSPHAEMTKKGAMIPVTVMLPILDLEQRAIEDTYPTCIQEFLPTESEECLRRISVALRAYATADRRVVTASLTVTGSRR